MANNTGFLLMAGLGALMFLGRGGAPQRTDEDKRLLAGQGRGGPMPMAGPMPTAKPMAPAFNLQSYVDSLFGDMATVPVQPPVTFFYPKPELVTGSGVPAVVHTAPEIITPTTKVQIGGDGGRTIVASSLAIIQQEQLDKQRFQAAANVQTPKTEATAAFNRDEEARQRAFADKLIKAARDAQANRNAAVVAKTREEQENIARGLNPDGSAKTLGPGMSVIVAGQPIVVAGVGGDLDVDFTPEYSETFVMSAGMDSPGSPSAFDIPMLGQSEYDDPGPEYYAPSVYAPSFTVHEITAAQDIGF